MNSVNLLPIVLVAAAASSVATATAGGSVGLHIEPQSLEGALTEFARQSGIQLLFVPDEGLRRRMAPRVSGEYRIDAGLQRLLHESGYHHEFINARTVAIQSDRRVRFAEEVPIRSEDDAANTVVDGGARVPDSSVRKDGGSIRELRAALPEVLVRGTKSLNADIERSRDDIQPYIVLDREAVERSGATDVDQLLRKNLSVNSTLIPNSMTAGSNSGASSIDLRGLGADETLILVDGRRAASYSMNGALGQPDLNSIPLAAIERIEVLPASASGIYGGGATGGVINVVLRRDYSGVETSLTYDNAFNGSAASSRFDLAAGASLNNGKTNFLLSGSYSDVNPLFTRDRDFYGRGTQIILRNNPTALLAASSPPLGRTTNICSVNSSGTCSGSSTVGGLVDPEIPLSLKPEYGGTSLASNIAYIPSGYRGAILDGGTPLLQTAGQYNLEQANTAQSAGGLGESLFREAIVKSARASIRHEFTSTLAAFVELSVATNDSAYVANHTTATFRIPRASPNNPFDQDVLVTTPTVGADGAQHSRLDTKRGVIGIIARLPWRDWQASLDYSHGGTELESNTPNVGITGAGTTAVREGMIDVLKDTNLYAVDFSQFRTPDDFILPIKTTLRDVALRVAGPVVRLPGGDTTLSMQVERTRHRLGDYINQVPSANITVHAPTRLQTANSAYAELRVPIVSALNRRSWLNLLELQAAARFDEYKSNSANLITIINGTPNGPVRTSTNRFSSVDPVFGARVAPTEDFMIRASYSNGFLPPALTQLVPDADLFRPTGLSSLRDPRRGGGRVTTPFTQLRGGNPELEPETSVSKSLGLVLTPRFAPGVRISWDWLRIEKNDNIGTLAPQVALNNELLVPGLVTRAPAQNDGFEVGPVTVINSRFLNLNRARIEAYDWAVDYNYTTERFGRFRFSGSGTQTVHSQSQLTPSTPFDEFAGFYSIPRWAGNATLVWEFKQLTWGWTTQYLGPYWYRLDHSIDPNQGRAEAPGAVYHDISVGYRFGDNLDDRFSVLSGLNVLVGIKNVFNAQPRMNFDLSAGSPDYRADPRVSSYYVTIRKAF